MADSHIKKVARDADMKDITEYLDYLADTLSNILENIDEENLTDDLKNKIGGK